MHAVPRPELLSSNEGKSMNIDANVKAYPVNNNTFIVKYFDNKQSYSSFFCPYCVWDGHLGDASLSPHCRGELISCPNCSRALGVCVGKLPLDVLDEGAFIECLYKKAA